MLCKTASIFLGIGYNNPLATSNAYSKTSFIHIPGIWWRDITFNCDLVELLKKVVDNASIHHSFPILLKRLLFCFLKLWMSL